VLRSTAGKIAIALALLVVLSVIFVAGGCGSSEIGSSAAVGEGTTA
jgi:hypothetical protein